MGRTPAGFECVKGSEGRAELWVRGDLRDALVAAGALDERPHWRLAGSRPSGFDGRGHPSLLSLPDGPTLVVKGLRHGGWFGVVASDRYFGTGRLERALEMLVRLQERGVRTPAPAFGRVLRRRGQPFLRLELATELVPGSTTLVQALRQRGSVGRELSESLGRLVRALHNAGVRHADLNAKNLLIAGEAKPCTYVLDVEGSSVREPLPWSDAVGNLERLYRSLVKTGSLEKGTHRDVLRFLQAYESDEWRRLLTEVAARYRRTILFHRIAWSFSRPSRSASPSRASSSHSGPGPGR